MKSEEPDIPVCSKRHKGHINLLNGGLASIEPHITQLQLSSVGCFHCTPVPIANIEASDILAVGL